MRSVPIIITLFFSISGHALNCNVYSNDHFEACQNQPKKQRFIDPDDPFIATDSSGRSFCAISTEDGTMEIDSTECAHIEPRKGGRKSGLSHDPTWR